MNLKNQTVKEANVFFGLYLEDSKDELDNLSRFLSFPIKYIIEIWLCMKLQGFDLETYYDEWMKICNNNLKREWKETNDWIHEYRKSPEYENDMEEFTKEWDTLESTQKTGMGKNETT